MKTLQGRVIPETIAEALEGWDAGADVQTIMMGGKSFGYELGVQVAHYELLRKFEEEPDFAAAMRRPGFAQDPELLARIEQILGGADALMNFQLDGTQGGLGLELARMVLELGYEELRKTVPLRRFVFMGNPIAGAAEPNRAQRRQAAAELRRLGPQVRAIGDEINGHEATGTWFDEAKDIPPELLQ